MNILTIISQNFRHGSRTRRPDAPVPFPEGFRGELFHNVDCCTACQTCAYVCSPGAITFAEGDGQSIVWEYFAGQCTYCGRCVEYCPTGALSFAQDAPAAVDQSDRLRLAHQIFYRPCSRCGQPVIPMPEPTLTRLYGDPLPADIASLNQLCEKCRRRVAGEGIKNALLGNEVNHGG